MAIHFLDSSAIKSPPSVTQVVLIVSRKNRTRKVSLKAGAQKNLTLHCQSERHQIASSVA